MSSDGYLNRGASDREYAANGYSFDELAKGMANGTISRGQALKLVGAALLGFGSLGFLGEVAEAKPKRKHKKYHRASHAAAQNANATPQADLGNSPCAHFCERVRPPGEERGKCTSAGAHGTGPCFECIPGVGAGPNFQPPTCPDGQTFNTQSCQCEGGGCTVPVCTFETGFQCGGPICGCPNSPSGVFCWCVRTAEGTGLCVDEERAAVCQAGCNTSQDCQQITGNPNAVCLVDTCCNFTGFRGECHIPGYAAGYPDRCSA